MADTYRPQYGDRPGGSWTGHDEHGGTFRFEGVRNHLPARPPQPYRTSRPPRLHKPRQGATASDRPLLASRRRSPEAATIRATSVRNKFRDVEDLTDTDETEMEISGSEEDSDPPRKRARLDAEDAPQTSSRWSNPDPYTSLPPIDGNERKVKDVVKLIRKARNTGDGLDSKPASHFEDQDFISFDIENEWSDNLAPLDGPSEPKMDRRSNTASVLGKRKRSEQLDNFRRRGTLYTLDGSIRRTWQASIDTQKMPWLRHGLQHSDSGGTAFHKEILDFYEWIRPRKFEETVRADVVSRLEQALNRLESGELRPFGSYAAGLYLPTGDLDLVYLLHPGKRQPRTMSGLAPKLPLRQFQRCSAFLNNQGIAEPDTIKVIYQAKVPIIKYVDRRSGLKVDLCFNNESGLDANETFQLWKDRYPIMPIIVAIVKHFLMIRGLNDVATGGLGGFSTICLVTCLVQHMPSLSLLSNLGQILLEFFNLYGNLFNRNAVAIRLDPPGFIDKASYTPHLFNHDKPGRLTIIDPNRPENNISGGTNKIELIFQCFSEAHQVLISRLAAYTDNPSTVSSFLEGIVGSDFTEYELQRDMLYELHYGSKRETLEPSPVEQTDGIDGNLVADLHTFPVEISLQQKWPRPPDAASTPASRSSLNSGGGLAPKDAIPANPQNQNTPVVTAKQRRAAKLKSLRPDVAHLIKDSISLKAAIRIGGYEDREEMERDLTKRD